MTTEINIETATEWLKDHYKDLPGIWEKFDIEYAAKYLVDAMYDYSIEMCGDKPATFRRNEYGTALCERCGDMDFTASHWRQGDYDDLPVLDLMCAMADAREGWWH